MIIHDNNYVFSRSTESVASMVDPPSPECDVIDHVTTEKERKLTAYPHLKPIKEFPVDTTAASVIKNMEEERGSPDIPLHAPVAVKSEASFFYSEHG